MSFAQWSILLMIVFISNLATAQACKLAKSSSWNLSDDQLIEAASQVLVAEAVEKDLASERAATGYTKKFNYRFKVMEILKGSYSEPEYSMTSVASPFPKEEKSERRFNAYFGVDCQLRVSFEVGKTYILFLDTPNKKSYGQYRGKRDSWYRKIVTHSAAAPSKGKSPN